MVRIKIGPNKPFYVERLAGGRVEWLRVNDWYFQAWGGCFCLICDRDQWVTL